MPGETGSAALDDSEDRAPKKPKRRRTSRRLTICTVCTAPFPAPELIKIRKPLYCLPCFERRENLFETDEVSDAKADRLARMAAARDQDAPPNTGAS